MTLVPEKLTPRSYSTTTLLLLAVNLPLVVLVGALLVSDYYREMYRATNLRRVALSNEAALIGSALVNLSEPEDQTAIERFLENSCSEAAGPHTPGHWIDVRWNDQVLHTHSGPQGQNVASEYDDAISGRFTSQSLVVEVTERGADIRSSVRGEILMHVSALLAIASVAALIVDFVLVYLIAKPTKRLAATVSQLEANHFVMTPDLYRSRELNDLRSAIAAMSKSLRAARADHRLAMERARKIQSHLLPNCLDVPRLAMVAHFQPAEDVAGDIYGVMKLRDESWLIYIADLVGHGIPAAISAAVVKMLIESAASGTTDPGAIMNRVNQLLPRYLADGEFATAAILRWQPEKLALTLASAGHEPVLLVRQRSLESLEATGIPLGIDVSSCWTTTHHILELGDRLLLSTDGVVEAHDIDEHQFGRSRLAEMFISSHSDSVEGFAEHLTNQLEEHCGIAHIDDDVTFLIAECRQL